MMSINLLLLSKSVSHCRCERIYINQLDEYGCEHWTHVCSMDGMNPCSNLFNRFAFSTFTIALHLRWIRFTIHRKWKLKKKKVIFRKHVHCTDFCQCVHLFCFFSIVCVCAPSGQIAFKYIEVHVWYISDVPLKLQIQSYGSGTACMQKRRKEAISWMQSLSVMMHTKYYYYCIASELIVDVCATGSSKLQKSIAFD